MKPIKKRLPRPDPGRGYRLLTDEEICQRRNPHLRKLESVEMWVPGDARKWCRAEGVLGSEWYRAKIAKPVVDMDISKEMRELRAYIAQP